LHSSVLRWPNADTVISAFQDWAIKQASARGKDVVKIGFFGSYARGDWGVGSDLDIVVIVKDVAQPFEKRAVHWPLTGLPVPADILIYTQEEWGKLDISTKFAKMLHEETVWVYP
jgi:hypothetical protein